MPPEFKVRTAPTAHPVQGLAYHITDTRNGSTIGISGDTKYFPDMADFFSGVDILVMEAAAGLEDPVPQVATHSSVRQSASIARKAQAGELYIVHTSTAPEEVLEAARSEFVRTKVPEPRMTITI